MPPHEASISPSCRQASVESNRPCSSTRSFPLASEGTSHNGRRYRIGCTPKWRLQVRPRWWSCTRTPAVSMCKTIRCHPAEQPCRSHMSFPCSSTSLNSRILQRPRRLPCRPACTHHTRLGRCSPRPAGDNLRDTQPRRRSRSPSTSSNPYPSCRSPGRPESSVAAPRRGRRGTDRMHEMVSGEAPRRHETSGRSPARSLRLRPNGSCRYMPRSQRLPQPKIL